MTTDSLLATAASGLIGAVTFSGSLVAFGKLQELKFFKKPIAIPYAAADQRGRGGWSCLLLGRAGHRGLRLGLHPAGPGRPGAGLSAGQSDRRRRHAGRHRPAEFLFRTGRRRHRIRDRQQRADHCRFAGRRIGDHPDQHHVQGHEPVVCPTCCSASWTPVASTANVDEIYATVRSTVRRRRGHDSGRRSARRLRARLRHGGRPGSARGAQPGQVAGGAGHDRRVRDPSGRRAACRDT